MTPHPRRAVLRAVVGALVALQLVVLLPASAGAAGEFRLDLAGKRDYVA